MRLHSRTVELFAANGNARQFHSWRQGADKGGSMRHFSISILTLALLAIVPDVTHAGALAGVQQATQEATQELAAQSASEKLQRKLTTAAQQAAVANQILTAMLCKYPGGSCASGPGAPASVIPVPAAVAELSAKSTSLLTARSAAAASLVEARTENAKLFALWQSGQLEKAAEQATVVANNPSLTQAERSAAGALKSAIQEFLRTSAALRASTDASFAAAISAETAAAGAVRELEALVSQLNGRKILTAEFNAAVRKAESAATSSKTATEEARSRKDAALSSLKKLLDVIRSINPQR